MLERMIEENYKNFLRGLFGVKANVRKRKPRRMSAWGEQGEFLEARQVLSALNGLEGAVVAETATHHAKKEAKHAANADKVEAAAMTSYPNVSGTWNLTVNAVVDGQARGPFQGTVQVSQTPSGKRITGNVNVTGFQSFRIIGKFTKDNLTELAGKARVPVDLGSFNWTISVKLNLQYSQDYQSFTGQGSRSIFGHDISVTMAGTKKPPA